MADDRPLAIDLCCGLGGFTEGLLAEGFDVVGIDIEEHVYGEHRYPAGMIIQDICTVDGRALSGASLFVASPPCQKYSYMAMPWSKSKALAAWYADPDHPERIIELNRLFNECFRIRDEASEAKGERIPIVVENVAGAQRWVGEAAANFGSFFLWGDVPLPQPDLFGGGPRQPLRFGKARKLANGRSKLPGFRFDGSGRSFQSASVEGTKRETAGYATIGQVSRDSLSPPLRPQTYHDGVKNGNDWFGAGENCSLQRRAGSKSSARKFASAMIAKIPETLARHIAVTFHPRRSEAA